MTVGYSNGIPKDNLVGIQVGAGSGSHTSALPYINQSSCQLFIAGSSLEGSAVYTKQSGYFTSMGNMVFVYAEIAWNSHTGRGNLLITGLPLPVSIATDYNPKGIVNTINLTLPVDACGNALAHSQAGSARLSVQIQTTSGESVPVDLQESGEVHLTITYSM